MVVIAQRWKVIRQPFGREVAQFAINGGEFRVHFEQTRFRDEKVLPAQDRVNLASILAERSAPGDLAAAREQLDVAEELQEANLPPEDGAHAVRRVESALVYLADGEPEAAEQDARIAVALNAAIFPDGSARAAYSQSVLGAALAEQGRLDEAGELLRPAYERLVQDMGPDGQMSRAAQDWLERWGLWEEAR
jgi:tetratricopeptide (TPR) repeat protein